MIGYSYTLKLNYFYHENDRIKECTIAKEIWDARGKINVQARIELNKKCSIDVELTYINKVIDG